MGNNLKNFKSGILYSLLIFTTVIISSPIPNAIAAGSLASFGGTFFEGWESGSLATNGWTSSGGSGWSISGTNPYQGSFTAFSEPRGTAFLETSIDTTGYTNINFSFYAETGGLDASEYIAAEWYNGTGWTNLMQVEDIATYTYYSYALPAGADNNSGFQIRFSCNAGNKKEDCNVDDIQVTGTPSQSFPVATTPSSITQSTSGSGYISFQTTISDADSDETRVKVEYSDDGGSSWYDPDLASVQFDNGSVDRDDANAYQIGTVNGIDTDDFTNITLTIDWDTKSASNGNGSLDGTNQSDIQVRVTPNDGIGDGAQLASANFEVDNLNPSGLTALTAGTSNTTTQVLNWSAVTETNFNNYEIWYGENQSDVQNRTGTALEWDNIDDANLTNIATTTTTITGLSESTAYYYKIWALDDYGNEETVSDISQSSGTFSAAINLVELFYENGNPKFRIDYTLTETNSTACNFTTNSNQVQYSVNPGGPWTNATIYGTTTGADSSPGGTAHTASNESLFWNATSVADGNYYVQIKPHNGSGYASNYTVSAGTVTVYTPTTNDLMRHGKFFLNGDQHYITQ
jgi:hypothetical protein